MVHLRKFDIRRLQMLILSRKVDEVIVIDGGIRLTIVDIRGDRVRVGIEAPQAVKVNRLEVVKRIEEEAKGNAVTTGIQLHGDSPRIVAGEAKEAERPAVESPS